MHLPKSNCDRCEERFKGKYYAIDITEYDSVSTEMLDMHGMNFGYKTSHRLCPNCFNYFKLLDLHDNDGKETLTEKIQNAIKNVRYVESLEEPRIK